MYTRKIEFKITFIAISVLIVLLLNIVLIFISAGAFSFVGDRSFQDAKEQALTLVKYNESLATDWGVKDSADVNNALSNLLYDIEQASSVDDLSRIVMNNGNETQRVIRRRAEARQAEIILSMISSDKNVRSVVDKRQLNVSYNSEGEIDFEDGGFLAQETKESITGYLDEVPTLWDRTIEVEVENGLAKLITPRSADEREKQLESELDQLKAEVESLRISSGHAEMSGEGIYIRLYDNPDAYGPNMNDYIIHDYHVLEIANELFASGAQGIAIDGRRLTSNSSIRCVGPLIHVDHHPISVDPIEIHAVGDPKLLESGLLLYVKTRLKPRGIEYEIEVPEDGVNLPAYTRRNN
ncbi:DUF881 domain-containing protein [Proteinivorax hydrogeniformans]|uniref:DUF881 domain-containing protein n=1 Tax=Proteinivorax hydrogeniformans TaxID=1826727 RepID=A0AAU8HWN7_9FIRM